VQAVIKELLVARTLPSLEIIVVVLVVLMAIIISSEVVSKAHMILVSYGILAPLFEDRLSKM